MKHRSIITTILIIVALVSAFAVPVNALTVPTFTWIQMPGLKLVLHDTQRQTDTGILVFDGVATSTLPGTYKMQLERHLGSNIWVHTGVDKMFNQDSDRSYHMRERIPVIGQYFKATWTGLGSGIDYRVVLYDPSKPQDTGFTYTRIDVR